MYMEKSMKELLEEAKIRYPIGSDVSNYNLGLNCKFKTKAIPRKHHFYDNIVVDGTFGGTYTIYANNKWADIIQLPQSIIDFHFNL